MPIYHDYTPPPPHRNLMVFIDGENMVCRYQGIAKECIPNEQVAHLKDVYVWTPLLDFPVGGYEIIRAYYYISASGDELKLNSITKEVRKFELLLTESNNLNLYPVIFKKDNKNAKAKGVDIQLTVDVLTHVYQNNVDTVCLFSGDGDYATLIEEVIRRGKKVYVAAFSNGFSPKLKNLADRIIDLDNIYFKPISS